MQLRKISETATTITLGWDPVPGAEGYLFYKDGVRVSKSFDKSKRTIKFSKPGVYRVQAIIFHVIDQDGYPDTPPPAVRVAPITVVEEGGSDQRVCLFESEVEGSWPYRPGVVKLPDGRYTDESRAIYQSNGLEDTSIRTKLRAEDYPMLVKARQMDGRNACQCPPTGDPLLNTGSWTV